jgi:hypothetical protein
MKDRQLSVTAFVIAFLALVVALVPLMTHKQSCDIALRQWDSLQESLMDCREDPDCYITPADLERVREMAPRVQACEGRAGDE